MFRAAFFIHRIATQKAPRGNFLAVYENLGFSGKLIKIEPWLGPNIEEMKTELHKRSVYLAQNDLERGGYRQSRPRNRWPPGIPYYA